jgi:hypothetical protein
MHAIILCPGPSLATYAAHSADLVIGVNRAALAHECNVWATLDYPMIRDNADKLLGRPNLLTRRQTLIDIARRPARLQRFAEVRMVDDLDDFCPPTLGYGRFSSAAALIYAAERGATQIDVYGADWAGTADFDGVNAGENRGAARWQAEAELWLGHLVPWLAHRGVKVNRL